VMQAIVDLAELAKKNGTNNTQIQALQELNKAEKLLNQIGKSGKGSSNAEERRFSSELNNIMREVERMEDVVQFTRSGNTTCIDHKTHPNMLVTDVQKRVLASLNAHYYTNPFQNNPQNNANSNANVQNAPLSNKAAEKSLEILEDEKIIPMNSPKKTPPKKPKTPKELQIVPYLSPVKFIPHSPSLSSRIVPNSQNPIPLPPIPIKSQDRIGGKRQSSEPALEPLPLPKIPAAPYNNSGEFLANITKPNAIYPPSLELYTNGFTSAQEAFECYRDCGEITEIRAKERQASNGQIAAEKIIFLQFRDMQAAMKARMKKPLVPAGRKIVVEYAKPKRQGPSTSPPQVIFTK